MRLFKEPCVGVGEGFGKMSMWTRWGWVVMWENCEFDRLKLTERERCVYEYVKANPGQKTSEVAAGVGLKKKNTAQMICVLRKQKVFAPTTKPDHVDYGKVFLLCPVCGYTRGGALAASGAVLKCFTCGASYPRGTP